MCKKLAKKSAKRFCKILSILGLVLTVSILFSSISYAAAMRSLNVAATASLTEAFQEMARAFENKYSGIKVNLKFASSNILLKQMQEGFIFDVFATADQDTMDQASAMNVITPESRRDFVRNSLVLIRPRASQTKPSSIYDLPKLARIAVGDPANVAAGRYARESLEAAGIWTQITAHLVLANNVRQVLDYVSRGQVDVGIVYATDAALRLDAVEVIATLTGHKPIVYPIALGEQDSINIRDAMTFITFVCSGEGSAILNRYGFTRP